MPEIKAGSPRSCLVFILHKLMVINDFMAAHVEQLTEEGVFETLLKE